MTSGNEVTHPYVSFAEVASESPDESVAIEAEATDTVAQLSPEAPGGLGAESDNDLVPQEPATASMLGPGPVSPGDDATI